MFKLLYIKNSLFGGNMRKLLSAILASVMLLSMVGCGSDSSSASTSDTKIALITDTLGSEEFLLQAYNTFMEMSEDGQAYAPTSVECADDSAWAEKSRSAAVQGFDLIIGVGWKAASIFEELIVEFPDTQFAIIDTASSNEDIMSVTYDTAHGAYVLGVLVGNAFPEETTFGYIGNFQNQSNYEYKYGFEQGLKSVIADAELIVNYADTFSDTTVVYSLAKQQAASGAKFIMGSVASSANEGLYQAALDLADEGKEIYTSGLSVDQTTESNPYIIGGLIKDTGAATRSILEAFLSGELTGGNVTVGFAEDAFCVVHINNGEANYVNEDIVTKEVIEAAMVVADEIKAGTIVLDVPIEQ